MWEEDSTQGWTITVGVFFQGGSGSSCAVIIGPDGIPRTQGWIVGCDPGINPPEYLQECGLLHALLLAERCITTENVISPFIHLKTGTWKMIHGFQTWFNNGQMRLKSAAASDIVAAIHRINQRLPCPMIITALPTDFFEEAKARGARDCDILLTMSSRLYSLVLPNVPIEWKARIARIPWTQDETKMYCKIKFRADEDAILNLLQYEGSTACSIYADLHLTRSIVKEVLQKLQSDRRRQVVFASIVCATRFKTIGPNNELQAVKCARCGDRDSFEHMLRCCRLECVPDDEDPAALFTFLLRLAREAARGAPVIPVRFPIPAFDEISLDMEGSVDGQIGSEASTNSLSFDEADRMEITS